MGRKQDIITKIRMAEAALGLTGAAKQGPLGRHTVADLKALWGNYYRKLEIAGLVKSRPCYICGRPVGHEPWR